MKASILRKNCFGKPGVLILSALLLSSCLTTQRDLLYLNDQIAALKVKVNKLEESVGDTALDTKLESIRSSQAETGAEIDKIWEEIQGLSGRLEENSHLAQRAIERDTTDQDVIKANLADVSSRIAQLELRVKSLYEYLGIELPPELKKQGLEKGPPEAGETVLQSTAPAEKASDPEKALYDDTLAAYKAEKYEAAIAGFKSFLNKYPKSDLADNAQFWIGECYMVLRQYEQAILAYQEVIRKYPKGNKVPNAMLRQALAFYEIQDKISSRLLLEKIVKTYPNSNEAKIAKAKLNALK
jgi:tol-pal system protein YbgF